jgi:flagellar basal-body rod protein FlgG
MALRAASTSAAAMNAQLMTQAAQASNVANAITPGYRARTVALADAAAGGVVARATAESVTPGSLVVTGNPLDFAIGGPGFFIVEAADSGEMYLTRSGAFQLSPGGMLVDAEGREVSPGIRFPAQTLATVVSPQGDVIAFLKDGGRSFLGTIQLARAPSADGLEPAGGGTYRVTPAAGALVTGGPGDRGFGLIVQGGLESSNVDVLDATARAILTARAFSADAAVFRSVASLPVDFDALTRKRRRRDGNTDVDLANSQAARLVGAMGHGDTAAPGPLNDELRGRLSARRLSAGQIAEIFRVSRRHVPERFAVGAGGPESPDTDEAGRRSFPSQELQLARRRAAQMRGVQGSLGGGGLGGMLSPDDMALLAA